MYLKYCVHQAAISTNHFSKLICSVYHNLTSRYQYTDFLNTKCQKIQDNTYKIYAVSKNRQPKKPH